MKIETKTESGTKVTLISGYVKVTAIFDHPQLGHIEKKGVWREDKMKVVIEKFNAVIWLTIPRKDYDEVYSQCDPLIESMHQKKGSFPPYHLIEKTTGEEIDSSTSTDVLRRRRKNEY